MTDPTNTPLPNGTWELIADIDGDGNLIQGFLSMDVNGDANADIFGQATAFGFADGGGPNMGAAVLEFLFDLSIDTLGFGGKAGVILVASNLVTTAGAPSIRSRSSRISSPTGSTHEQIRSATCPSLAA